jgi:hypothetical protein
MYVYRTLQQQQPINRATSRQANECEYSCDARHERVSLADYHCGSRNSLDEGAGLHGRGGVGATAQTDKRSHLLDNIVYGFRNPETF